MTANQPHLVAVYGTLKRGECNHRLLLVCPCLGRVLLSRLQLYNLGPYPMAVACADPAATVAAELYAVSATVLVQLDVLEDHPREYERQRWSLVDGRQVWVYLGRPAQVCGYPLMADGIWRSRC
jgi:gamma-glutamylcyclotransferase (GGCT)/AIG2-like uncharacterized protein YtfP